MCSPSATTRWRSTTTPGGYAERFDGIDPGGGERPGELQKLLPAAARSAGLRMEEEQLPGLVVDGSSTSRSLAAGHRFTLERHVDGDGDYVLTSVRHSAQVGGARGDELTYRNTFTCISAGLPFRPRRRTPRPVVPGVQSAVVVGPAGESVFTDRYGRVKVQFHWDREGRGDEHSSCWIRVSQPVGGGGRGFFWIPEVGDEVIVGFLEGDPDRPIVLGRVYDADDVPPRQAR